MRLRMFLGAAIALTGFALTANAATKDSILTMTGNLRTVVIWDEFPSSSDALYMRDGHSLKCFDTQSGQQAVVLSGGRYQRPLIGQNAARIAYTNPVSKNVWIVNINGTGNRRIHGGFASDFWYDAATGKEWVYLRPTYATTTGGIMRVNAEDTTEHATVITGSVGQGTESGWPHPEEWFQVSPDGKRGADAAPWPRWGTWDLTKTPPTFTECNPNDTYCWISMSPDTTHRLWGFTTFHDGLDIYTQSAAYITTLNPCIGDEELPDCVYWPKWSNHPNFFTCGTSSSNIGNQTNSSGTPGADILLERIDAAGMSVDKRVNVTNSPNASETAPDAYVFSGASVNESGSGISHVAVQRTSLSIDNGRISVNLGDLRGARVDIVDVSGKTRAVLADGACAPTLSWDGSAQAPGTYFVRVKTNGRSVVRTFTLAR